MSSTKCVWIRFKTKSDNAASMGNKSSPSLSACTTSAGAYDPLEDIARICQEHKIWFHVDGAHGASAAFSDTHRHLVAGMERADSVVLDFHKLVAFRPCAPAYSTPTNTTATSPSLNTQSTSGDHADEAHWWDTGKRTFECTKRMLSTRLAAVKAEYGWGFGPNWSTACGRWGPHLRRWLRNVQIGNWPCPLRPTSCVFVQSAQRLAMKPSWNEVVRALRKRYLSEGSGYLVQTEFDGRVWLRCTMMNPLTEHRDLEVMLGEMDAMLARVTHC